MNTITRTCLVLGLMAIAGCTSPHPTSSAAPSGIDSPRLAGEWGILDTSGIVTFAPDGSVRLASGGTTQTGSYEVLGPDVVILTFPATVPDSSPRQIKYYYLRPKTGQPLLTDNFLLFDSLRKRQ